MKVIMNLFQGLISNPEFAQNALSQLEQVDGKKRLLIASAYLRSTGVQTLASHIELAKFDQKTAFIGVNNQSTSYQGIDELKNLNIDTYAVNTNRREAIFHPKVMLSIGENNAVLITGSANLTAQGMTRNFEHTFVVEFDLNSDSDIIEVQKIENSLNSLPSLYPDNVTSVSAKLLNELLISGQLENEDVYSNGAETKGKSTSKEKGPAIPMPKRPKKVTTTKPSKKNKKQQPCSTSKKVDALVWRKNKLSKSDAQISGRSNTNVKGYMTMGNKSFRKTDTGEPIDNKTYMRETVFGDLNWAINTEFEREEINANFELYIDGILIDTKSLMISHKESREPSEHGGDDQKQPLTALHVCGFGQTFHNALGKDLELYKVDTNNYRIKVS